MTDLSGKVIIVTGASRGIGARAAIELAARGASLTLAARKASSCRAAMEEISNNAGTSFAASCDMANYSAVESLVEETLDRYGKIDALINNAGVIEPIGLLANSDPVSWARSISVNLTGVYHGTRAVLPHFKSAGGGVIVNISSGAAHNPLEGWSAYCSGKAGVAMLTRATALENRDHGVHVYGFAPGAVDTDMQGSIRASQINKVSRIPREDLAPTDQPAKAIAWLCSSEAEDLSGEELTIRDAKLRRRIGLPPLP